MQAYDGFQRLASRDDKEQRTLLNSNNFSLRPLSTAGPLDLWTVLSLSWQPVAAFWFTILVLCAGNLRFSLPGLDFAIYIIGVVLFLAVPIISLCVLWFGVVLAFFRSRINSQAVIYWTYWPFLKVVLMVTAVCVGTYLGNDIWYNLTMPHYQYAQLQSYQDIDPLTVSGTRLQDSSIVLFNASSGVDRSRTGCLKNNAVYCVAPIMYANASLPTPSGQNQAQLPFPQNEPPNNNLFQSDFTHRQQYDLFMVGTDCCSCPGEFRCGDWNKPGQLGGMRVLGAEEQKFYRLAAQEWAATHSKLVVQPIFYKWVADPVTVFNDWSVKATNLTVLYILLCPPAVFVVVLALSYMLRYLCYKGFASPSSASLVPPDGLGREVSRRFLPNLYKHEADDEAQHGRPQDYPTYLTL